MEESRTAERFAGLALACVQREFPNKIAHAMNSDADARPPRELTPAFYGCYDWHSAVHGHWLLARLSRLFPDAAFVARARAAFDANLTPANILAEVRYLECPGRAAFERPYGLAWVLQLALELREWDTRDARRWAEALAPLERSAVVRLKEWLPKLSHPVRSGEHSQSAFALGLMLDYARGTDNREFAALLEHKIRTFFLADRDAPLAYEPSGEDFVSPCLAEADAVRRVLPAGEFAAWLGGFLPGIPRDGAAGWLAPAATPDASDPKLGHLDGLNLSRAWMLNGIGSRLPAGDSRLPAIRAAAAEHARAGLSAVTGKHYEGAHWLGTFAVYLMSGRGISG
jgi:hypothetical protein